ncbi:MAG: hypothetical protein Q8N63_00670 [Nanoarchaeota archaeon]|nr:hypothetical protein [Nanoarchaeota archaeon]
MKIKTSYAPALYNSRPILRIYSREGKVSKFIELDKEGSIVRIA